jgi:hypothetical protein
MTSPFCKMGSLIGFSCLVALQASATLFDESSKESCAAFVHIDSAHTTTDNTRTKPSHSSYSAHVLSANDCWAKPGEVIRFIAPGGSVGDFAMMVNAIDITQGSNIVVHLSKEAGSNGLPFVIRTSNARDTDLKHAFQCSRVGSSGPSLFWRNRIVEMRPSLPKNASLSLNAILDAMHWAAQQWSNAGGSDFKFQIGQPVAQRWVGYDWSQKRPNYNIVTVREDTQEDFYGEWMHAAGVVALTRLTYVQKSGEIVDADIEINLANFSFEDCAQHPRSCKHSFDLKNTLTHEFGHILGLAHPDESLEKTITTTMFANSLAGEIKKRWLSPDDILGINFLYPPGKESPECYGILRAPKKDLTFTKDTGCSQSNTPPFWAMWLGIMFLFWRILKKSEQNLR